MKRKGISLIVLIITIVVIIILAASIILNMSKINIINNANAAVLKQDIATLQSELDLYKSDRFVDERGKYDATKLSADTSKATYGDESIEDKNNDGNSNIHDILTSLKKSRYKDNVYIQDGKLVFKKSGLKDEEIEIILEMGLQVDGMPKVTSIETNSEYTSIEVSLNVTLAEEVEKVIYILNDGEREESKELTKTYTGLTAGVNYTLEVILVLKDGTEISRKEIISTKSLNGEIIYTLSETDWTNKDVKVEIDFSEDLPQGYVIQYKLSGSVTQDWTKYTEPVIISKNTTTLIGRVYNSILDEEKVGSSVTISKLDKDIPTVPTELNLTTQQDTVIAIANGSTDATSGVKHYEYSINNQTWQTENTFTGLGIGEYTVYARAVDNAGNVSDVKAGTVEVKMQIDIAVEYVDLLNAKVSIDYGNVSSPEYKIGTNGTWQIYENVLNINSQDIIDNKLYNEDYTLTIYARGTSSSGIQGTVNTVIDGIDLQAPEAPVITSSGDQYPIITEYGVGITGIVSIVYPENVTKLYSLDGENWQEYVGEFESNSTKTYAKAVKESGLETYVESNKKIAADALGANAYDGKDSTGEYFLNTSKKIYISPEMQGNPIRFYFVDGNAQGCLIKSYDENGESTLVHKCTGTFNDTVIIPTDSKYIQIGPLSAYIKANVYEISPDNKPVITGQRYYPTITENGVQYGYNEVEIEYFQTSVQKLYRIGTEGEWKPYTGKVKVIAGNIIYAKGLDKNNKETRAVSEYEAKLPDDALGANAYDGKDSTGEYFLNTSKKIYISPEMQGKTIRFYFVDGNAQGCLIKSYDENGEATLVHQCKGTFNNTVTIPTDSKYIQIGPLSAYIKANVYEVSPVK